MKKATALLAICVAGVLASSASAAVIYRQDFDQGPGAVGNNTELATGTGWNIQGQNATGIPTDVHPTGAPTAGISSEATAPSNGGNTVDSPTTIGAPSQGSTAGRTFFNGTNARFNGIMYTNTLVDTSKFSLSSVTWFTRNGANGGTRLAFQVGGQWYAGTPFINVADAGSTWTLQTDTLASETWTPFTFTPGVALDQTITGTAGPLPAGNITAFGLYLIDPTLNGNVRVDGFTINGAVPEPAGLGLLVCAAPLLMRRRSV